MCDTDFGDRQLWGQAPDPVLIPRAPFVQAAGEGEAVCTRGLSELTVPGRGVGHGGPLVTACRPGSASLGPTCKGYGCFLPEPPTPFPGALAPGHPGWGVSIQGYLWGAEQGIRGLCGRWGALSWGCFRQLMEKQACRLVIPPRMVLGQQPSMAGGQEWDPRRPAESESPVTGPQGGGLDPAHVLGPAPRQPGQGLVPRPPALPRPLTVPQASPLTAGNSRGPV